MTLKSKRNRKPSSLLNSLSLSNLNLSNKSKFSLNQCVTILTFFKFWKLRKAVKELSETLWLCRNYSKDFLGIKTRTDDFLERQGVATRFWALCFDTTMPKFMWIYPRVLQISDQARLEEETAREGCQASWDPSAQSSEEWNWQASFKGKTNEWQLRKINFHAPINRFLRRQCGEP